MYKFLTKHGTTVALALGIVVIAIFLITVSSGLSSAGYDMGTDLNDLPDEAIEKIGFFDPVIKITTFLAFICAILAFVVFSIWDLTKFPKTAIKFLIGFGVLVAIFFALYSSASPVMPVSFEDKMVENNITDSISQFISAGIWTTLGLVVAAVLAIVLGGLRNAFK